MINLINISILTGQGTDDDSKAVLIWRVKYKFKNK